MAAAPKITRRGFASRKYPVPELVRQKAEEQIEDYVRLSKVDTVLAELRLATYCGPESAGARGAYMLELFLGQRGHALICIEPVKECEWFANCSNEATETRKHGRLGDVPICSRCARMIESLETPVNS